MTPSATIHAISLPLHGPRPVGYNTHRYVSRAVSVSFIVCFAFLQFFNFGANMRFSSLFLFSRLVLKISLLPPLHRKLDWLTIAIDSAIQPKLPHTLPCLLAHGVFAASGRVGAIIFALAFNQLTDETVTPSPPTALFPLLLYPQHSPTAMARPEPPLCTNMASQWVTWSTLRPHMKVHFATIHSHFQAQHKRPVSPGKRNYRKFRLLLAMLAAV